MTLVCAAEHCSVPVLLGDVLLSADGPAGHAEIATFDDPARLTFRSSERIAGLATKLVLVRPNLAIGWAGTRIHARSVMRFLQEKLPEPSNIDDLKAAFAEFARVEHTCQAELVGSIVFNENKTFSIFHWDGLPDGHFATGPFFVAGTGSEALKSRLDLMPIYKNETQPIASAAGWALQRAGFMLADEILLGANLPDYFGGGFDVAFFDGRSFRRVASLIQLFLGIDFVALDRPAGVSPSGTALFVDRYGWGFRGTSFWQSFRDGCLTG